MVLISELTAKTMWAGKDAVGQTFTRGGTTDNPFTVIGVVKDARTVTLAKTDPMMVYMPYWYRADNDGAVVLTTRQDPSQMAEEIRRAVWSVDPAVAVPTVQALGGIVEESVANRRFEMDLLLLFAVSALLLAALGIYGVVTYSVVQREREIGLRIALGARRENIYKPGAKGRSVAGSGWRLIGTGIAFALAQVAKSLLFEVSPYNPTIVALSVGAADVCGGCGLPAACTESGQRGADGNAAIGIKQQNSG